MLHALLQKLGLDGPLDEPMERAMAFGECGCGPAVHTSCAAGRPFECMHMGTTAAASCRL